MQKDLLEKLAESGARKICGIGMCTCPRKCDHKNHAAPALETDTFYWALPVDDECPLKKYGIIPDDRKWFERTYEESTPTNDEIFAICALCEHADVVEHDDYEEVRFKNLDYCITCPVKDTVDYMQETEAEAASS